MRHRTALRCGDWGLTTAVPAAISSSRLMKPLVTVGTIAGAAPLVLPRTLGRGGTPDSARGGLGVPAWAEDVVLLADRRHRRARRHRVPVAGVHDRVVGQLRQPLQALVHLRRRRCRAGRCARSRRGTTCRRRPAGRRRGSTGCPGCAPACGRARRRSRRRSRTSPGSWASELAVGQAGRAGHPRHLVALHVDRAAHPLEQPGHAFDRVAHHRTPDVVGVVVRRQHAGDASCRRLRPRRRSSSTA